MPTKAIQSGQQGDYVFVVTKDGTADPRQVTTTGTYQNLTLVKGGLNSGDTVIVDGQLRVAPNGKVTIQSSIATQRCRRQWNQLQRRGNRNGRRRTVSIPELFIKRPIMTTLVMAAILIFGIVRLSLAAGQRSCRTSTFPPSR